MAAVVGDVEGVSSGIFQIVPHDTTFNMIIPNNGIVSTAGEEGFVAR